MHLALDRPLRETRLILYGLRIVLIEPLGTLRDRRGNAARESHRERKLPALAGIKATDPRLLIDRRGGIPRDVAEVAHVPGSGEVGDAEALQHDELLGHLAFELQAEDRGLQALDRLLRILHLSAEKLRDLPQPLELGAHDAEIARLEADVGELAVQPLEVVDDVLKTAHGDEHAGEPTGEARELISRALDARAEGTSIEPEGYNKLIYDRAWHYGISGQCLLDFRRFTVFSTTARFPSQ